MNKRTLITLFLVAALVAGAGVVAGVWQAQAQDDNGARLATLPAAAPYQATTSELATANLYQRVSRSIAHISVLVGRGGTGTGSGFVIDTVGHIVTNNHVVEGARYIEVTFVDGNAVEAEIVGRDPDADLAVIRIDPENMSLSPIAFADSDQVFVGQEVLAIGSPFGQDFTLTTGIVSALDRSLRQEDQFSIPALIQTDAAINPGNSGGPLLDRNGNVIGVNTAIMSETRSASGVGFAIPANTVRRIVPYLIENGSFRHSWLGIAGSDLQPEQRDAMNLSVDMRGIMVSNVVRNGPAAVAGLVAATDTVQTPLGAVGVNGDIITGVNGTPVAQMSDLIAYLEAQTLPGDAIQLNVWRNGGPLILTVTLGTRP